MSFDYPLGARFAELPKIKLGQRRGIRIIDAQPQAVRKAGRKTDMHNAVRTIFLGTCAGLAVIWGVVGFVFLMQVQGMRTDQAKMEREVAAANGRVDAMERTVRRIEAAQAEAPRRREAETNLEKPIVALSDTEIALIRQFIKIPPPVGPIPDPEIKIGDSLAQSASLAMPQAVVEKFPRLVGTRFTIDRSGAIAISRAGEDRVGFLIPAPSLPPASPLPGN